MWLAVINGVMSAQANYNDKESVINNGVNQWPNQSVM
jgi:hypothetical protein